MVTFEAVSKKFADTDLQRADGALRIVMTAANDATHPKDIFQRSPLRVLFPKFDRRRMEQAVLINTAGGIAGGDRLEYGVTTLANARITVSTQAAEKVYRAISDNAHITTKLQAFESSRVAWLPQETIVFNDARLKRQTEVEVHSGAELLAAEWLVLGRTAHGENVVRGNIVDSWRVKRDGRLIWADTFRLTDEVFPELGRSALLSKYRAIGTFIYFNSTPEAQLECSRQILCSLSCRGAATLVGGVVLVRLAAKTGLELRIAARTFLQHFGARLGPTPLEVPKMWYC